MCQVAFRYSREQVYLTISPLACYKGAVSCQDTTRHVLSIDPGNGSGDSWCRRLNENSITSLLKWMLLTVRSAFHLHPNLKHNQSWPGLRQNSFDFHNL